MALQVCPKCNNKGFTWSMDEEISAFTVWTCSSCGYIAKEDENRETECPRCEQKCFSYMLDSDGAYWWCCKCDYIQTE